MLFQILQLKDIFDIVLVALLLYYIYRLMKSTGTINIFLGVMAFLVAWILVTRVFEMELLGSILDKVINVGIIALIILFQEDIKRFMVMLGSRKGWKRFSNYFSTQQKEINFEESVMPIVLACRNMSKSKVGALIVIERNIKLGKYIQTGEKVDAQISAQLIENIFFKNSPLHDGAMIISQNRIQAAACILPVSHDLNIPKSLGLRHRSALGISQDSDALSIIVSEETGRISIAKRGRLKINISAEELERILTEEE